MKTHTHHPPRCCALLPPQTSSDQQTIRSLDSFFRNTWRAVQQRAAAIDHPRTSGGVPQPPTPMPPLLQQHAESIAQLMQAPANCMQVGGGQGQATVATVRPGVGVLQRAGDVVGEGVHGGGAAAVAAHGGGVGVGKNTPGQHSRASSVDGGAGGVHGGGGVLLQTPASHQQQQHVRTQSSESCGTSTRIPPATREEEV